MPRKVPASAAPNGPMTMIRRSALLFMLASTTACPGYYLVGNGSGGGDASGGSNASGGGNGGGGGNSADTCGTGTCVTSDLECPRGHIGALCGDSEVAAHCCLPGPQAVPCGPV